jgi:circadian clock protein KaiC
MLGGAGFYRGSTVLLSGTAGTGKTSLAAHFVNAAGHRGERSLYLSFEESPGQLIRNMSSIGIDLQRWVRKGVLQFHSSRPTLYGLEMHLATIHKLIEEFRPEHVVLDPVGSLTEAGNPRDANTMLIRLMDFLKLRGITAFFTNLTSGSQILERTEVSISSLVDTWLLLRDIELGGERNRAMYVLKSRGMAHSNQLREFLLTDNGIELLDVYVGPDGVLTGSSRLSKEMSEKLAALSRREEAAAKRREQKRKREALEARILALRKEFEAEEDEAALIASRKLASEQSLIESRSAMALSRKADRIEKSSRSPKKIRSRNEKAKQG